MAARGVPLGRQVVLPVRYKGHVLKTVYKADFVCYDTVLAELKALTQLCGVEEAQILNYLKATGFPTGLLLNFGTRSLQFRRFILSESVQSV